MTSKMQLQSFKGKKKKKITAANKNGSFPFEYVRNVKQGS